MKKKVLLLGSTGSIGRATLEVIANQNDAFEVTGLACRNSVTLLKSQVERFRPAAVCLYDPAGNQDLHFPQCRLLTGMEGIREMIGMDADIVVNALPGSVGLEPTVESLKQGRVLALANKESLVMAGRVVRRLAREGPGTLIPVDSEHSALYQLLMDVPGEEVKTLIITASGGPFRDHSLEAMARVKPEEALNHPTWKMGKKVTLDSATLMNKGFEVIEARWLFDIAPSLIKVLIHPESMVHGIVELADSSFLAHMAHPDMKIPISYALNGGRRVSLPVPRMDFEGLGKLTFLTPDMVRFPLLRLAYEALHEGDSAMITMNVANEIASQAFLDGRVRFTDIASVVEKAMERHPVTPVVEDLDAIREIHLWGVEFTENLLRESYA